MIRREEESSGTVRNVTAMAGSDATLDAVTAPTAPTANAATASGTAGSAVAVTPMAAPVSATPAPQAEERSR